MKADADLKTDVEEELSWDPAVDSTAIGVAVKDGIVTLTGHIETFAQKRAAEKAVRRVAGVRAIALELDVRLSPEHRRSDTDIAVAAEQALKWSTLVPDRITVTVDKGRITLRGEVDWEYQRGSAEKAVRDLVGVTGVNNQIGLRTPTVTPPDLRTRIVEALKRQVEHEVKHIDIQVEGSTVTLRGRVGSCRERDAAQGVAWSAPGVRALVNELTVD